MLDQDRDLVEELATCGLAASGEPAALTVDVAGAAVHVIARRDGARIVLEARVQAPTASDPDTLVDRTLDAPGDSSIVVDGPDLVARRSLIEPPRWLLHDAVHELAKRLGALRRHAAPVVADPGDPPAPSSGTWVFVDTPTSIVASGDPSTPLAVLVPGTWYEVLSQEGSWVLVHHPAGADGWVPTDKVVFS